MLRTQVRPARPDDARALHELLAGLSTESGSRRFFVGLGAPSAGMVAALLRRDSTHGAWVCAAGDRLVGHAIWGLDDGAAELGVVVADAWQRRGIGRSLTAAAAAEARGRGLVDAHMLVQAGNRSLVRRVSAGATAAVLADGLVSITRPLADLLPDRAAVAVAPTPSRGTGRVLKELWARFRPDVVPSSTTPADAAPTGAARRHRRAAPADVTQPWLATRSLA